MASHSAALRVIQVSDCHLFKSEEGRLLGLNTTFSLDRVLDLVRAEQPAIDLILATGDLSQDGSPESYRRFHERIGCFGAPVYWLPGNHDLSDVMRGEKAVGEMSPCVVDAGGWRLVLLDSTIRGKVPGRVSAEELEFLRDALASAGDRHVLVALHHQPVPVGAAWLDEQKVGNGEELLAVLDTCPGLRAVIWGHVHQDFRTERNGVRFMSVPSTCVQFEPGSVDFAIDRQNPGYRWLDLHPDGRVDTGVSRVTGITFEIDYRIKGY